MATEKIIGKNVGNNTVGGASMENASSVTQTTVYDIKNSHYEVVRIFGKNKDVKSLIKETISVKEKEGLS
ncbi:MAG: hypothetical protein ACLUFN_03335 [Eubacterium sp.]